MRWKILGEREAFRTPWLSVWFLAVRQPDGTESEYHHVVRLRDLAVVAAVDDDHRVLMMLPGES